jgi:hypothetical protein
VSSTGATDLLALVMFVVDATQPFSAPAEFPATGLAQLPRALPRTGETPQTHHWAWTLGTGGMLLALGLATLYTARALRRVA